MSKNVNRKPTPMMPMNRYESDQVGIRSCRAIRAAPELLDPALDTANGTLLESDAMRYSFHTSASVKKSCSTVGNTYHAAISHQLFKRATHKNGCYLFTIIDRQVRII